LYRPQVKEQRKTLPKPVIIEKDKEFEVEKILTKKKYLEGRKSS